MHRVAQLYQCKRYPSVEPVDFYAAFLKLSGRFFRCPKTEVTSSLAEPLAHSEGNEPAEIFYSDLSGHSIVPYPASSVTRVHSSTLRLSKQSSHASWFDFSPSVSAFSASNYIGTVAKFAMRLAFRCYWKALHFKHSVYQTHLTQGMTEVKIFRLAFA